MGQLEKKIAVGILGGTGYGAGELLRLLAQHPHAKIVSVSSASAAGKSIAEAHPHLSGFFSLCFDSELRLDALVQSPQAVVFSALPHGKSGQALGDIIASSPNITCIDLSGDLRLKDTSLNDEFYPEAPKDKVLRGKFAYGLSEVVQTKNPAYIANPGCLASACILSVAPLMRSEKIQQLHFDAKTGTSGAGRGLREDLHHPGMHANSAAYKILEHRHEAEIREVLEGISGTRLTTSFVPHLLPVSRGILVTASCTLPQPKTQSELIEQYRSFYKDAPFIRVRNSPPELRNVVGSNFCDVSVFVRDRQVIALSALDNLIKGMAGQAIQNMNLMHGLPEETGLGQAPLGLV